MKKRATRFLALTLALMCALSTLCLGASASEVSPRYTGISLLDANINVSSRGKAECYGYVQIRDGYSVDMTVELKRDGRTIKSWSDSGKTEVEIIGTHYVTSGHDYQTVVSVDVYNSRGTLVDSPSIKSVSQTARFVVKQTGCFVGVSRTAVSGGRCVLSPPDCFVA